MSDPQIVIVGTRLHHGVGGCMADGLRMLGIPARFVELYGPLRRGKLGSAARKADRCLAGLSPWRALDNWRILRAVRCCGARAALVTNGRDLAAETVIEIRHGLEARGGGIAVYLCDDPFNPIHRSEEWLRALREYSLVVSTKRAVISDLIALGCRRVEFARFGYDPLLHRPADSGDIRLEPGDTAFVGNADRARLPFVREFTIALPNLRHRIYGHGWERESTLRSFARPPAEGASYRAAIAASTVSLCLLRHANRDGHTMRSFELPAMRSFMLAERTAEHQEIFEEGVHCEFWSGLEELVAKTMWYCSHPRQAAEIAERGHQFVKNGRQTYGDRAIEIFNMLIGAPQGKSG